MTDIKWYQPDMIEAYNTETGETRDVVPDPDGDWPDVDGEYWDDGLCVFFNSAGENKTDGRPLIIRNRADNKAQPAPSPELPDDVLSLLRRIAGGQKDYDRHAGEARAILAELEPKPDPLAETVKEVREQLGPKFRHLAEMVAEQYLRDLELAEGEAKWPA